MMHYYYLGSVQRLNALTRCLSYFLNGLTARSLGPIKGRKNRKSAAVQEYQKIYPRKSSFSTAQQKTVHFCGSHAQPTTSY